MSSIYECPRVDDAAGYVLRALPEGEWEAFRYHLGECHDCTEKVDELTFVSHAMLNAEPQHDQDGRQRTGAQRTQPAEAEAARGLRGLRTVGAGRAQQLLSLIHI